MGNIPILGTDDENFKTNFEFTIWSTQSSSDYRNNRKRPYNGQPWTDHGERGKTLVKGLTMRDIVDCMVQGFLAASDNEDLQKRVFEIDKGLQDTEYASDGSWRYQDIYEIDLKKIDPGAVIRNTACFIEHYMGIYPNVDKKDFDDVFNELFDDNEEE